MGDHTHLLPSEDPQTEDDESIEGLLDGATGCYLSNQLDDEDQLDDGKVRNPDAQHDPVASMGSSTLQTSSVLLAPSLQGLGFSPIYRVSP